MRITNDTLRKIAADTTRQRTKDTPSILAAYLCGSLNGEGDPLLGGSGDVDMVFVHEYTQDVPREIVRLTDEITLDIRHHSRTDYKVPRALRSHPWLGPVIYSFHILHDPRHFLDFTQAGLRDQYFRPSNVLARAQNLAAGARRGWQALLAAGSSPAADVRTLLQAAADAANAFASLEGDPLPKRRLLLEFFKRTQDMGQPGAYTTLLELIGAGQIDVQTLNEWLKTWETAYCKAAENSPDLEHDVHPDRVAYFRDALQYLAASERPTDALWLLLESWASAAAQLPEDSPAYQTWLEAMGETGWIGEGFSRRVEALDRWIDLVEDTLEAWGKARGVGESGLI